VKNYSVLFTLIVLALLLSVLVITGCGDGDGSITPVPTSNPTTPVGRQWTYMVYMGADNNLSDAGLQDLNEMEMAGSTAQVAIVVQAEFSPAYSTGVTTDTLRFYVQKDNDTTEPNLNPIQNLGNVDMGSPAALTDFIKWAAANYPAENYALILWDHGAGWKEMPLRNNAFRGAIQDETSDTFMSLPDLAKGVRDSGVHIDMINFDACLMAMYEVVYEFKGLTDYMVFSEELEPGDGNPYDTILADLVANPTMSPANLSITTANRYHEFYQDLLRGSTTLSAVDMSKIDALDAGVLALAGALTAAGENAIIEDAQVEAQAYAYATNKDLWDFCDYLSTHLTNAGAINAANQVKTAVQNMVIANKVNSTISSDLSGSHGIAIYFPTAGETSDNEMNRYSLLACNLARASASGTWGAFVQEFTGSGGGGTATYGDGGFEFRIDWTGDSDVDLWVREPKADGDTQDFASGYTSQETTNGNFSPDSYISGFMEEEYAANDRVYIGDYYFAVTYYKDETYNYADVTAYYRDPVNGINNWQTIGTQRLDSTYTTSQPWWIPIHYNVTTSSGGFEEGTISRENKEGTLRHLSDKK